MMPGGASTGVARDVAGRDAPDGSPARPGCQEPDDESASAPETMSSNSVVIAVWRWLW